MNHNIHLDEWQEKKLCAIGQPLDLTRASEVVRYLIESFKGIDMEREEIFIKRKSKKAPKMYMVRARVSQELILKLHAMSKALGTTDSDFIRFLLDSCKVVDGELQFQPINDS